MVMLQQPGVRQHEPNGLELVPFEENTISIKNTDTDMNGPPSWTVAMETVNSPSSRTRRIRTGSEEEEHTVLIVHPLSMYSAVYWPCCACAAAQFQKSGVFSHIYSVNGSGEGTVPGSVQIQLFRTRCAAV